MNRDTIKPSEIVTYRLTPELRYVHDLRGGRHLQQRWIDCDGTTEWRDVLEVAA